MIWDEFLRHFRFCDEEDSGLSDEEQERKGPKNRPKHTRKRDTSSQEKLFGEIQNSFLNVRNAPTGRSNRWNTRIIYRHLEGKSPDGQDVIGVYAIFADNTCNFLCADFDDKSCEYGYQKDVLAYVGVCKDWGVPCFIERSRSGNGAHVWIFFEQPLPASKARRLGNMILTEATERYGRMNFKSYDRFFPNQDRLPEGGFGNLVALPLQGKARKEGNSVFVDENFMVYENQWYFLLEIERISEMAVDAILAKHETASELGELSTTSESKPWETPVPQKISHNDFPANPVLIRSNMLYIPLQGFSAKVINHLKRIASFKNPEFYARQGMRLSTYNIPRIISCADMGDDYIALPRGCEDAVVALLEGNQVAYRVEDKTNYGENITVEFKGKLREEQKAAIANLVSFLFSMSKKN